METRRGSYIKIGQQDRYKVLTFDDQGPADVDVEGDGATYPTLPEAETAAWKLWDDLEKDTDLEIQVYELDENGEMLNQGPVAIAGMSTSEPTIGSGETVTREEALEMLKNDSIPEDKHLMILNWAPDQHPNEWIGVFPEEWEQVEEYTDESDNFELWDKTGRAV